MLILHLAMLRAHFLWACHDAMPFLLPTTLAMLYSHTTIFRHKILTVSSVFRNFQEVLTQHLTGKHLD